MVTDPFPEILLTSDNVLQANHLASVVQNKEALNQVYNVAHGERTTLNQLFFSIRNLAAEFDKDILAIEPVYGPARAGDIHIHWHLLKKLNDYYTIHRY